MNKDELINSVVNDWYGDAEFLYADGKLIGICGWNDVEYVKPYEEQLCKILIRFTFTSVKDSNVELITRSDIFEGIYRGGTWAITRGDMPSGFIENKVTKWIPLNVSEEKEFSIKDVVIKAIAKDMHDKIKKEICEDLNEEQIQMITNSRLECPNWFKLNAEQEDIVKKIAAEFPYRIELVSGIFIEQKFSEEKTRYILMKRLVKGW